MRAIVCVCVCVSMTWEFYVDSLLHLSTITWKIFFIHKNHGAHTLTQTIWCTNNYIFTQTLPYTHTCLNVCIMYWKKLNQIICLHLFIHKKTQIQQHMHFCDKFMHQGWVAELHIHKMACNGNIWIICDERF